MQDKLFLLPLRPAAEPGHISDRVGVRFRNLPTQLTPLIGREQEVAAVCTLLHRREVRLLTLTGPGGVGKTRLALQIASNLLDDFADGVYFVQLSPISDPELVLPTIAHTLGLWEAGDRPLMEHLQASLRGKQLLLLLDNFEQVVQASPLVVDLLYACSGLKVLVTSRAVLHVSGEHEFLVSPLALPDLKQLPASEFLSQYAAVTLFLHRAQAIKPDFHLTPVNAPTIAEICARLDGLPLAIELAAARIKLLPPQALLKRLEHRLSILTGGACNSPFRQQTLRNTIQWSYDLLSAQEQRLFRRLAVFVGGFTLPAVETLCAALDDEGAESVSDGVNLLINKSLLRSSVQVGDEEEPRLGMLETIRTYALERLTASGELEATRKAHAAYYLALAEEARSHLAGLQQVVWLERLEREHDNLRAAMQWGLSPGAGSEGSQRIELALQLASTLQPFWLIRGHLSEGQSFLERALASSEGATAPVRAGALTAAARQTLGQGDYQRGEALCQQSLALCQKIGDTAGIALSLYLLGIVTWRLGRPTVTQQQTEQALALYRQLGDKDRIAYSLFQLAYLVSSQGEYARACLLLEECLALHSELGNKRGIAHTLLQLAQVLFFSQGNSARIYLLIEESLALSQEVGFKEGLATSLWLQGRLALVDGDAERAHALAEQSAQLYREIGHRQGLAQAFSLLARVIVVQGDYATARALYEESLAIAREIGDKMTIAVCLEGLADMVVVRRAREASLTDVQSGELSSLWAAHLWGAAESLREAIGAPIPAVDRATYERSVKRAHAQFGAQAFAKAWAAGRTMSLEEVLAARAGAVSAQQVVRTPSTATSSGHAIPTNTQPVAPAPQSRKAGSYPNELTAREVEILRLVAQGCTDAQVAGQLVISPRTVNWHLSVIYSKLGVSSRCAATRYTIEQHLV
jgi:predicted ATPase/DNA-binding CsgD family transcriptional regulator